MSHLAPDRLAALADDEPNAAEAAHIAVCAICARERRAYQSLRRLAADARTTIAPPLVPWGVLAAELRDEGYLRSARPRRTVWRGEGGRGGAHRWLQAAAALLLMAGGVAIGRWSAHVEVAGPGTETIRVASAESGVRAAVDTGDTMEQFASIEDAISTLARAQRDYSRASAYLAARDTAAGSVGTSTMYRTRLAALDAMAEVARQAVREVPHDPLVNQYYLSTLGAREATLRQLGTTLPAGTRLTGF